MVTDTRFGTLLVQEIIDNEDGTANVIFDISDEFKEKFIKFYNLSEWSDDFFNKFVVDALTEYALKRGLEDGNN